MPASLAASYLPKGITRGNWGSYHGTPTAGQTYKVGDHLILGAAGTLEIAAADTAAYDASGLASYCGISEHDAVDVLALPSTPIERRLGRVAIPVDSSSQFLVAAYHGTPASAVIAATDLDPAAGPFVLPLKNVAGQWVADVENDGTDDSIQIVERHDKYPYSTAFGWFWAKVVRAEQFIT